MTHGADEFDALAYELAQTDFDAVERGGLRAAWSEADDEVVVEDVETDETVAYDAEDLVRAASDREVEHARVPSAREG